MVNRTFTVSTIFEEDETIIEDEVENDPQRDRDSMWPYLLILIIIIVIILLVLIVVARDRKKKREEEREKEEAMKKFPTASTPALNIAVAAPAQVQPQTGPYAQSAVPTSGYGVAQPAAAAYPSLPPPSPYGGYASAGAGGSAQVQVPTQGSQYVPPPQLPTQVNPLLLPSAPETPPSPTSTVACFNCGAQVPIPIGTNILTCPSCGAQGKL